MPKDEEKRTYLEEELDATITYAEDQIEFVFHRAKVKLSDELEIQMLKTLNPEFNKAFKLTEDQLLITYTKPKSYQYFEAIHQKNIREKWQFAYNIIQQVQSHSLERLKLIISPDNILIDQGLVPHFLHYGVSESIPPYEVNEERLWNETKAMIAVIADHKYDFSTYLGQYETLDLSKVTERIMYADTYDEIIDIIEENIHQDEAYEKTVIHIPQKKWKFRRYLTWILIIFLIPSIVYTAFALFFKIPEINAYVESHRYYLEDEYSSVIDTLRKYDHEKMPRVVQYQLANSYVVNESLKENQRENVLNMLTLQTDRKYLLYWIDIGRGDYQEAVDRARVLEERDLIVFALLKQREDVKSDQDLSGEEREEQLKDIESDIDEYQQEMEEEKQELEEAEEQENEEAEETEETDAETSGDDEAKDDEKDKESSSKKKAKDDD